MTRLTTDSEIRELIENAGTIAVVGLSPKEHRDSHRVAKYLQSHGFRIIPVNPNASEVLGEQSYARLTDIPDDLEIDIVDVFRRSDAVGEIAEDAVSVGAKALWMQIGIVSESAAIIADEGGLSVVMDRCLMVDHGRLSG